MLRFCLYARKSDDDSRITSKSIREQLSECQQVEDALRLFVVRKMEESHSAMQPGTRPLYNELMRLIDKGEVNAILCWNVNRLVRNMEEGGKLAQLLIDGHIKEIRTPTAVYRSGDNIMPLVLEAANSTQYSLNLRNDVRRGMEGHVDAGGWNSKAYQGYRNARDPENSKIGLIVPDPERFPLMRKAWELMLTGTHTPAQVVRVLNEQWGYRTRKTSKAGGTPLARSYAYKIFANPFYAGFVRYKGRLMRGNHTPMVTEAEFNLVQQHLNRHLRQYYRKHSFPYTGLMRCGYCGCQITAEQHQLERSTYVFYRCSNARRGCNTRGLSEARVEQQILGLLAGMTIDANVCTVAYEIIDRFLACQVAEAEAVRKQQDSAIADIDRQLSRLTDMWLRGLLTEEERFKSIEKELESQRERLLLSAVATRQVPERVRDTARQAYRFCAQAREQFIHGDASKRREIARAVASEYVFFGKERRIEVTVRPVLAECVRFATTTNSAARREFEPASSSSESQESVRSNHDVSGGRRAETPFEVPEPLITTLSEGEFPRIELRTDLLNSGAAEPV